MACPFQLCSSLVLSFLSEQADYPHLAAIPKKNNNRWAFIQKYFNTVQDLIIILQDRSWGLHPGGVLPYITYTGMCRPTWSWFWSSWFRTGRYPFQRRFLERGIIFRTHESSSFVSSHLKLFKDRLLLKIGFNALTSNLLYSCCTLLLFLFKFSKNVEKIDQVCWIQYGGKLRKSAEQPKTLHMRRSWHSSFKEVNVPTVSKGLFYFAKRNEIYN